MTDEEDNELDDLDDLEDATTQDLEDEDVGLEPEAAAARSGRTTGPAPRSKPTRRPRARRSDTRTSTSHPS